MPGQEQVIRTAFAATPVGHAQTGNPLLKRLTQLVMTDEAFHHRFGKI